MDYNGSPLVFYHGDIKGYKLYEGTISGDGIYNYSFYRYWQYCYFCNNYYVTSTSL